ERFLLVPVLQGLVLLDRVEHVGGDLAHHVLRRLVRGLHRQWHRKREEKGEYEAEYGFHGRLDSGRGCRFPHSAGIGYKRFQAATATRLPRSARNSDR